MPFPFIAVAIVAAGTAGAAAVGIKAQEAWDRRQLQAAVRRVEEDQEARRRVYSAMLKNEDVREALREAGYDPAEIDAGFDSSQTSDFEKLIEGFLLGYEGNLSKDMRRMLESVDREGGEDPSP